MDIPCKVVLYAENSLNMSPWLSIFVCTALLRTCTSLPLQTITQRHIFHHQQSSLVLHLLRHNLNFNHRLWKRSGKDTSPLSTQVRSTSPSHSFFYCHDIITSIKYCPFNPHMSHVTCITHCRLLLLWCNNCSGKRQRSDFFPESGCFFSHLPKSHCLYGHPCPWGTLVRAFRWFWLLQPR